MSRGTDCSFSHPRTGSRAWISQAKRRLVCLKSWWVKQFGDSSEQFYHSGSTKRTLWGKHFQQCSISLDCYCNEHRNRIHWIVHEKTILVSDVPSGTISETQRIWTVVDFDAANNCHPQVTTMKEAMHWAFKMVHPQIHVKISKIVF